MKKTLLILPCNKGAKVGNYFSQLHWKKIDKILKEEGLRDKVDLAAIDCIITFKKLDGKGAIVAEYEMNRVKGFDIHPGTTFQKNSKEKIEKLIKDVKVGLQRLEKDYNKIVIFVNVASYCVALKRAIKELKLEYKVTFIEWIVVGFGLSNKLLEYVIHYIKEKPKGFVKINDRKIYKWRDERRRNRAMNIYKKSIEKFSTELEGGKNKK